MFENRYDAGRFLAGKLTAFADRTDVVVLALPRGGVPIGYEIAKALNAPLDIFLVRKLGAPIHPELAMGAIASGGVRVLNEDVVRKLRISPQTIDAVAAEELRELNRREQAYRGSRPALAVQNKVVILTDDGLATGASMRAAVMALKLLLPAKIIVAVPVGAPDTCAAFREIADEVICGITPDDFGAVGMWYEDFSQTTDEEVCAILATPFSEAHS
jgi:putative phosphoribosyl transferase